MSALAQGWALRISMGLARDYSTPITYWMELPLLELVEILRLHNEMCDEARQRAEAAQY